MADNNLEEIQEIEKNKKAKEFEKTIWSVNVGSQTLYKAHLDGRTRIANMSLEENKQVADILDKAIADLAKILEKRTTQHEVVAKKEQVTRAADIDQEHVVGINDINTDIVEEKEENTEAKEEKVETSNVTKASKTPITEQVKDEVTAMKERDKGKTDGNWNSIFKKLRS